MSALTIILAAVAYMVIGMIWYGPLFGKEWMKLTGIKANKKNMALRNISGLLSAVVMAYVLSTFVGMGISSALLVAFWIWFGFYATSSLGMVLWENKPFKLYLINNGFNLLSLLAMAVILA
jgi:hypothetical protein